MLPVWIFYPRHRPSGCFTRVNDCIGDDPNVRLDVFTRDNNYIHTFPHLTILHLLYFRMSVCFHTILCLKRRCVILRGDHTELVTHSSIFNHTEDIGTEADEYTVGLEDVAMEQELYDEEL